jgi:hypothetical protein
MKMKALLLGLALVWAFQGLQAQETEPEVDTTTVDTIVIRRLQETVTSLPRGVRHTVPKISFNKTQTMNEPPHRFKVPSFWTKKNNLNVQISEVAFVNWNAGGNNSITGIGKLLFERNYKFRYVTWYNTLDLRYGSNAQEGRELRKTDDQIRLSSTFGYRTDTISPWYYSVKLNFNTQFANGYKYPNTDDPISRFMAPGYLFLGAGASYIPDGGKFNLYISPLTLKTTFVLDQTLADKGAFGVDKAIRDEDGNIITPGANNRTEVGFLITNKWETEVAKNIHMTHTLGLYTDYLNSFGNIDIDWEMLFKLKVNKHVSASIGTHIIYDDDVKFDIVKDGDGNVTDPGGARVQFKQILGVGLNYDF